MSTSPKRATTLSDESLAERLTAALSPTALGALLSTPNLPDTLRLSLNKATPVAVLDAVLGPRLGVTFGVFRWVLARWVLLARTHPDTLIEELVLAREYNPEWTEQALVELTKLALIPPALLTVMLRGAPIPALVARPDLPAELRWQVLGDLDARAANSELALGAALRALPGRESEPQLRRSSASGAPNFTELLTALARDGIFTPERAAQLSSTPALEALLGPPEGPAPGWVSEPVLELLLVAALEALARLSPDTLNLIERVIALAPTPELARAWATRTHERLCEISATTPLPGVEHGEWSLCWGLAAHELAEELSILTRMEARYVLVETTPALPQPSRDAVSEWLVGELGESRQSWVLLLDMLEGFGGSLAELVAGVRGALA